MADEVPQLNVTVKQCNMGKDMQNRACEVAMDAFNSYKIEKDIATKIKRTFDEEFGPQYDGGEKYKGGGTWHCIVGRDFGCAIAHETKHLIFFKVEQVDVLLFMSME